MFTNRILSHSLMVGLLLLAGMAAAPPHQDATPTSADPSPVASATAMAAPQGTPIVLTAAPPPGTTETPTLPPFPTWISPTPDETGAIVVIVQPGDSLWAIAARAGLSLPDLMALNSLTGTTVLNPGDALVVGYATPASVLPEAGTPSATPPPPTPQPTESRPEAAVCLTAFDDLNQDGVHDANEPLRAGVAFTVYNTQAVVANYITDGLSEPKCLGGLLPGEYRVTRSIMPGEVLTTAGDWSLNLAAGGELHQSFGSFAGQARTAVPPNLAALGTTPAAPQPSSSPAPSLAGLPGDASFGRRIAGVIALFLGGLLLLGAVIILLIRQALSRPEAKPEPHPANGERRFRDIDDLE
jgi:hypothetical protein